MVATVQGKEYALAQLANRRETNKSIKHVNNAALYAGSPMYFYCIGCGAEIVVPEGYITKPDMCVECRALVKLGWMH